MYHVHIWPVLPTQLRQHVSNMNVIQNSNQKHLRNKSREINEMCFSCLITPNIVAVITMRSQPFRRNGYKYVPTQNSRWTEIRSNFYLENLDSLIQCPWKKMIVIWQMQCHTHFSYRHYHYRQNYHYQYHYHHNRHHHYNFLSIIFD